MIAQSLIHVQLGIQLAKRAKTDDTATIESAPPPSMTTPTKSKMSVCTFGTIQAPRVNIPAVPLRLWHRQTDTWPPTFVDDMVCFIWCYCFNT